MNYTEVTDLALGYSDRADNTEVVAKIDLFLRVVEARINRRLETLKMSALSTTPIVTAQEFYALPTDFLSMRSIDLVSTTTASSRVTLDYINPEQMANAINNSSAGDFYTIISDTIQIYQVPDNTHKLSINYYKRLPALTSIATTNWLADSSPDCYVFGLLVEINAFVKDAEAKAIWDERFMQSIEEIITQNSKSTWSGTALQTKVG